MSRIPLLLGLVLLVGCKWTKTAPSTSHEGHPPPQTLSKAAPPEEAFPRYTPVVKVASPPMFERGVGQFFGDAGGIRKSCHALLGHEVLASFFAASPKLACARMTLTPEQTRARIDQNHRHEQVTAWGKDSVPSAGFSVEGDFYITIYLFPAEGVIVAQSS